MPSIDPIDGAIVPGWPYVYVIGSFDNRITFYSQQVRAFDLANSLVSTGVLKGKTDFAVVGAGAAGLSVSAALSLLIPDAVVHIFEREQRPMHLQAGSRQRNLHPHIYDWPRPGARNRDAGLPFLNWTEASADSVAEEVLRQFRTLQAVRPGSLELRTLATVTAVDRIEGPACRVTWRTNAGEKDSRTFHAVFLAIGFGRERRMENAPLHSYWSDRGVPDAPRYAEDPTATLVTGSGDGGLIDLCAAALDNFDHTALIERVTNWAGIDSIGDELVQIDANAETVGEEFDFMAAYDRSIGPRLRQDGLIDEIVRRLRQRVRLIFNTQKAHALSQPTSTLNRLLTYLIFTAARDAGIPVEHVSGQLSVDQESADSYKVAGRTLRADEIFVRHGTDRAQAFADFESIRTAYEEGHKKWLEADARRRNPPRLSLEAEQAYKRALELAGVPVPRRELAAAVALQPLRLRIAATENPQIVAVSGTASTDTLVGWWGQTNRSLVLECAASPVELGSLAVAIARFAIHAHQVRIETDEASWGEWLASLTLRSPHTRALLDPVTSPVIAVQSVETPVDRNALATSLHDAMDRWTLERIDEHLATYLATGQEEANWIAWRIEPALRASMAARWADWRRRLQGNAPMLARTLRLIACSLEDDDGDLCDRQVLVGRQRIPSAVKAIVLALAAAEAWPISVPRLNFPGNFERRQESGEELATIHATGANLIEGQDIAVMAGQHEWSTSCVLLSELNSPINLERANLISLASTATDLRLDTSPIPSRLIIAADLAFQRALESGTRALESHFRSAEERLRDEWGAQLDDGGQK